MRWMWTSLTFLLALGAAAGFADAQEAKAAKKTRAPKAAAEVLPQPTRAVPFKTIGDVTLNLHLYEPAGNKATNRTPAIVFFFGGGWVNGSPTQFARQAAYLASRGVVAICAEYRIRSTHGTSPYECVADGKSAIRWVRAHAKELGIDPDRIASGGGSAGGHVAVCTGVIDAYDEPGEDKGVSSRPNAMVLFNPVIDTSSEGYGNKACGERWKTISPVDNVRAGQPPTIVFHGTADTTCPFAGVERFQKNMQAAGNRCHVMAFEGQKHGFFNAGRGDDRYFYQTTEATDRFLASLGYLKGEPTIRQP